MKLKSILFLSACLFILISCNNKQKQPENKVKVLDIDGNEYDTVKIGNQVWMVENLKTTKYRNGEVVPNVTDKTAWINLTTGAYCNYNNDINNVTTYGRLYTWYAVSDSRNIAPVGWHVPTDAEWTTLINYLGGESIAGGKLKETGLRYWYPPNESATNEYCFTSLPGGYRNTVSRVFNSINLEGFCWSSTELDAAFAMGRSMDYITSAVRRYILNKKNGVSVRCLRD